MAAREQLNIHVAEVSEIWSDLDLMSLAAMTLDRKTVTTLSEILSRLVGQYRRIRMLQDQSRETDEQLKEVRHKAETSETELARCREELERLKKVSDIC